MQAASSPETGMFKRSFDRCSAAPAQGVNAANAHAVRAVVEANLKALAYDRLFVAAYPCVPTCWRRPKTEPLLRVVPTQN